MTQNIFGLVEPRHNNVNTQVQSSSDVIRRLGADESALLALMERTGYNIMQENGQRKYGPPPDWVGSPPPRGCEIFVGKIPRNCFENELVPAFERIGKIYEVRLMMDFSGTNRGYCFITYTNRQDAQAAILKMNNYEMRPGRFIGVCASVDNCRLFVGGIPKNKKQDEILQEMKKITEGVADVILYPNTMDKSRNRGFAFVEYVSHRAAAMARRKLIPGRVQLFGHQIAVDWAEPEHQVDEQVMSKVKILYVRNLIIETTEEKLISVFNQAAGRSNAVERVKKLNDYAFIHFNDRNDAVRALHAVNGSSIDGSVVEVCLAKPVDRETYIRYTRSRSSSGCYNALDELTFSPTMFTSCNINETRACQAAMTSSRSDPVLNGPLQGSVQGNVGPGPISGRTTIYPRSGDRPSLGRHTIDIAGIENSFSNLSITSSTVNASSATSAPAALLSPRGHLNPSGYSYHQRIQGIEGALVGSGGGGSGTWGAGQDGTKEDYSRLQSIRYGQNNGGGGAIQGGGLGMGIAGVGGEMGRDIISTDYARCCQGNGLFEILSEYCRFYDLGAPFYQLETMIASDGRSDVQLFICKLTIPRVSKLFISTQLSAAGAYSRAAEQAILEFGLMNNYNNNPGIFLPSPISPPVM